MDPQSGLTLFNAIATAGKTIYEVAQGTSKLETKQQLMNVYDTLMDLKREAAELEDANRDLRQKLRFRGDDFEFKNPLWYERTHPERPLCPKCFGNEKAAPMSEPFRATGMWRRCLVCGNAVEVEPAPRRNYGPTGPRSEWG